MNDEKEVLACEDTLILDDSGDVSAMNDILFYRLRYFEKDIEIKETERRVL